MIKIRAAKMIFLLAIFIGLGNKTHAQSLVVEGGTLIDGTGRPPIKNAIVVIEGDRFKAVGEKGKIAVPRNATIIRADGKTILPGLIDTQGGGLWASQPPLWLRFGVTSVYYNAGCAGGDVGRALGRHREEQAAVGQGLLPGPRMFLPVGYFDGPIELLVPDRREQMKAFPADRGYAISVRTPQEAMAAVEKLAPGGGDNIAVYEGITPELLRALSDAAHKQGLVVVGRSEFAAMTSENGQDITCNMGGITRSTITSPANLAKLNELKENRWQQYWRSPIGNYEYMMEPGTFDALIQKMVRHHVYFAPAISHVWWQWGTQIPHSKEWEREIIDFAKNTPGIEYVPRNTRELWMNADKPATRVKPGDAIGDQANANHPRDTEGYAKQDEFVRRFVKAGGKIMGGGNDQDDMMPGIVTHQELEQMVYSGLTPMQAILSVTKWPAEAYHKQKEIGSVEPGKLADLIVVRGNPLLDIKATRNVEIVIVNGKQVNTALDSHWKNPVLPFDTFSPASLEFAGQKINTSSAPSSFTLTNTGHATVNVADISASGPFLQTNDCHYQGEVATGLKPGERCTITVVFQPTSSGPQTGAITVSDNSRTSAGDPPRIVNLTGIGLQ